ncbi:receptor-type tyrosine-protein phosphatase kappa isoform X3 [Ixodes scapularis]|uniref:receptor-type tyrosine-protein phosphatase kappa isoform X3 n=1 Tax=Ixodes scapularis TaxID=6945 RepID=UPI001AD78F8A|nr:receptor-type tyrosine-protein phosphatase kappa isoform X3 [Ixodes scapularis]
MFFDAYKSVPFLPRNYTVSASPGDKLTIAVTSLREGRLASWTKVDSVGKATVQLSTLGPVMKIPSARLQHGGIYVANGPYTRSPGKNRAIIRVIVRVCRAGLYGPSCNFRCPSCQNGGVCHDITGDCICPPGFKGQLCEQQCGDDYFGQDCSKRCSDTNPDRSVKSCRGILMCRPDPYGCSCGTGFTGFFCNETCPAHHYGADCKQSRLSFCKTESSCDIHTGTCAKDRGVCLEGWKNSPFCDISYPLLRTKPSVTEVKDTSAIVSFNPWNASQHYGEGTATDYWIQYRKLNESWHKIVVAALPKSAPYSRTLRSLRSGETYEVRVLVIDTDKKFRQRGALTTEFRTLCGKPTSPPKNVKVDNSSTHSVIITWQNPGRETWLCWSANVTLEVNGTLVSFNLTESGVNPTDRFVVHTRPFTRVTVRLRLDTPDGASSQWTGPRTVTSAEDAPSEVRQLQMTKSFARQASFAWLPPANANSRIRYYVVIYKPLRLSLPCSPIEQTETRLIVPASSQRVSLEKLHPYTLHRIFIYAITVKPGPNVTATFTTEQAVPEGAPTSLQHATVTGLENVVYWGKVPCDLANGVVSRYYLELDSADPWESELRNLTTTDMILGFSDLLPYTRYRARVYAENAAGRSRVAAELNFTTLPTAPPAPSNLTAYQLSQTNVSLSWQPPYPPYGVLDRYQVKFWTSDTRLEPSLLDIDTFRCSRGNSNRHCFTVPNLLPVRLYHFSVRAFNKGTTHGPYSVELEEETRERVPDAPASVHGTDRAEDSLRIQWDEPLRKNGYLKSYRVNVSLAHSFSSSVSAAARPRTVDLQDVTMREYYLRDLYPGSTYRVCVQASTSAGFGDAVCDSITTRAAAPVVRTEPRVNGIVNNTVNVALDPVDFAKGPITAYYLLVVRGTHDVDGPVVPVNFSDAQKMQLAYYTAAMFTPDEVKQLSSDFVVGAGNVVGGFENPPLSDATPYRIGLLVASSFSDEVRYGYRLSEPVVGGTAGIGVILVACLVLLVLVFVTTALTYCCLKKRSGAIYRSNSQTEMSLKDRLSRLSKLDDNSLSESRMTLNMGNGDYLEMTAVPNRGLPSKPVPVKELQEHVIHAQAQDTLKDEYATLPRGQLRPWDTAKKQENKSKNRYENILPYDHSRVILSKLPDVDHSDYINANYVPGYNCSRKYIATQGPKSSTVPDFWRMVWEEGCCKVVMLSSLKEQEKTKCEKYWPDASQKYGKYTVTLMKTDIQVDFIVREFQLALEDECRTVVQFHFTTWPDDGVPLYPDALLPFLRRIWDFEPCDDHPIVVHCSGGIGRTGTLILIDSMLAQAEAEGEVNLIGQLHHMRQNRINLVESLEQYVFAYMALVEILCFKSHKLAVKDFVSSYHKLKSKAPGSKKSILDLEMEELARACFALGDQDYKRATDPRNASKNRSPNILAADTRRPLLRPTADGSQTDYINAVYVDGFKRRKAYLVTQMPLPETVGDFWQMVAASGAKTLVTLGPLEDETCPMFWPEVEGSVQEYQKVSVELAGSQDLKSLIVRTLKVAETGTTPRVLKQFHLDTWTQSSTVPFSCDLVLKALQHVDHWQSRTDSKTVIVQCRDGCRASGLFCASAIDCEQLKLEQELDVFRTVRTIRASRPQFIVDSNQYAFCYDLARAFLDTFDTYSNFQ